jgi:hypothetical protein
MASSNAGGDSFDTLISGNLWFEARGAERFGEVDYPTEVHE